MKFKGHIKKVEAKEKSGTDIYRFMIIELDQTSNIQELQNLMLKDLEFNTQSIGTLDVT